MVFHLVLLLVMLIERTERKILLVYSKKIVNTQPQLLYGIEIYILWG